MVAGKNFIDTGKSMYLKVAQHFIFYLCIINLFCLALPFFLKRTKPEATSDNTPMPHASPFQLTRRRSTKRVSVVHEVVPSLIHPSSREDTQVGFDDDGIGSPLSPSEAPPHHGNGRPTRTTSLLSFGSSAQSTASLTQFQKRGSALHNGADGDEPEELLSIHSTTSSVIPPRSGDADNELHSFHAFGPAAQGNSLRSSIDRGTTTSSKGGVCSHPVPTVPTVTSPSSKPLPHCGSDMKHAVRQIISHNGEEFEELPSYPSLPLSDHGSGPLGSPQNYPGNSSATTATAGAISGSNKSNTSANRLTPHNHCHHQLIRVNSHAQLHDKKPENPATPSPVENPLRPTESWTRGISAGACRSPSRDVHRHPTYSPSVSPTPMPPAPRRVGSEGRPVSGGASAAARSSSNVTLVIKPPQHQQYHDRSPQRSGLLPHVAGRQSPSSSRQKQVVTLADIKRPEDARDNTRYLPVQHRVDLVSLRGKKNRPATADGS